jgi:hypothetical protein
MYAHIADAASKEGLSQQILTNMYAHIADAASEEGLSQQILTNMYVRTHC